MRSERELHLPASAGSIVPRVAMNTGDFVLSVALVACGVCFLAGTFFGFMLGLTESARRWY